MVCPSIRRRTTNNQPSTEHCQFPSSHLVFKYKFWDENRAVDDTEPLLVTNLRHFGVGDTTGHIPRSQRLVSWHAGSVMTWCSFAWTQGSLKMHLEMSENDSGGNLTNLTVQCLYLLEMRCFAINFLNGISVLSLRFDLNLWQKDLKSGVSSVLKRVWAGKHPWNLLLCSEFGLCFMCFMCFMCLDKSRLGSRNKGGPENPKAKRQQTNSSN